MSHYLDCASCVHLASTAISGAFERALHEKHERLLVVDVQHVLLGSAHDRALRRLKRRRRSFTRRQVHEEARSFSRRGSLP